MALGETLLAVGNHVPVVRERSERTQVNVGALVLTLPLTAFFFVASYASPLFTAAWILSAVPGLVYAGIFGEDMRAEMITGRSHYAPGRATEIEQVDSAINSQLGVILGGNYATLTLLGLALRYIVLG